MTYLRRDKVEGIAGDIPPLEVDDPTADAPTADDWAVATDTISYEIVTRVGPRVFRRYVGDDR